MTQSTEHQLFVEQAKKLVSRSDSSAVAAEIIDLITPILLSPLFSGPVNWPAYEDASRVYAAVLTQRHAS